MNSISQQVSGRGKLSTVFAGTMLLVSLISMSLPASAVIVYDQAAVDGEDGLYANPLFASPTADDFQLSADSSVETISWWGFYLDPFALSYVDQTTVGSITDSFSVRLLSDNSGSPADIGSSGEQILSGSLTRSTSSLQSLYGDDVYQYDLALDSALSLSGSETYYLSIGNELLDYDWYWSFNDPFGGTSWDSAGIGWDALGGDLAFSLDGTTATNVPEPSSFYLLLLPLLLLRLRCFRRNSQ